MRICIKNKYTIYGIIFGGLFPITAILSTYIHNGIISSEVINSDQLHLIYLISTAPFVLGIAGYLIGIREEKLCKLINNLDQEVKELADKLAKEESSKAVNSMIVTYNHEILNPLTVAVGGLGKSFEGLDKERYEMVKGAHVRINEIIKKISSITSGSISYQDYSQNSTMLDINKK